MELSSTHHATVRPVVPPSVHPMWVAPPLNDHTVLHLQPAIVLTRFGAGSFVVVGVGVVVVVVVVVVDVVVDVVDVEVVGAAVIGFAVVGASVVVVEATRGQ